MTKAEIHRILRNAISKNLTAQSQASQMLFDHSNNMNINTQHLIYDEDADVYLLPDGSEIESGVSPPPSADSAMFFHAIQSVSNWITPEPLEAVPQEGFLLIDDVPVKGYVELEDGSIFPLMLLPDETG